MQCFSVRGTREILVVVLVATLVVIVVVIVTISICYCCISCCRYFFVTVLFSVIMSCRVDSQCDIVDELIRKLPLL